MLDPNTPETKFNCTIDPARVPRDFEPQIQRSTFTTHIETGTDQPNLDEIYLIQAERDTLFDFAAIRDTELSYIHELLTLETEPEIIYPEPNLGEQIIEETKEQFLELYHQHKETIAAKHQYDLGKISKAMIHINEPLKLVHIKFLCVKFEREFENGIVTPPSVNPEELREGWFS